MKFFFILFALILSSCGGDSNLSEECSYYNKAIGKEAFSGMTTQAIQELEQRQSQCSSGALDIGGALTGGAGLNSQPTADCLAQHLRAFKTAHGCK